VQGDRKVPPVEDMRLYRRGGIFRFWYVPVAALLAIFVAVGVVWGADQFMGGGDAPAGADDPEPTPADTNGNGGANGNGDANGPTPAPTNPVQTPDNQDQPTPTPAGDPTPVPPGELGPGATAIVSGTGACLRIRAEPGLGGDEVVCIADGERVTIVAGPQSADGYTWWSVEHDFGAGWAAGEFLEADGG
jgi:hypothetical protein